MIEPCLSLGERCLVDVSTFVLCAVRCLMTPCQALQSMYKNFFSPQTPPDTTQAMIFHQGSASDFDGWVLEPGTYMQWGYSSLRRCRLSLYLARDLIESRYFAKFESFLPHPSFPFDPRQRGSGGPVSVLPPSAK